MSNVIANLKQALEIYIGTIQDATSQANALDVGTAYQSNL